MKQRRRVFLLCVCFVGLVARTASIGDGVGRLSDDATDTRPELVRLGKVQPDGGRSVAGSFGRLSGGRRARAGTVGRLLGWKNTG